MTTAYEEDLLHSAPGQAQVHKFYSRRSTVLGTRGMVACSQPLAAEVHTARCMVAAQKRQATKYLPDGC